MAEVVDLKNGSRRAGDPIPSVVGMLEELVERAKKGDIIAFGYAVVNSDGTIGNGFDKGGDEAVGSFPLGSAILILSNRFATSFFEEPTHTPK